MVILGIFAEVAYSVTSYAVKHEKEADLLFRGMAYQRAIGAYYQANQPGTVPTYPRQLSDLLMDPRFLHQRYLRQLYPDPMGTEWQIVRAPDGGIAGVASQSQEKPLKQDNFPAGLESFGGAAHYSQWTFLFQPGVTATSGAVTGLSQPINPGSMSITNAR